jgi:hypothetical protein
MNTMTPEEREQHWRKLVMDWHTSGESAAQFVKHHGVSASNLRYWEGRLGLCRTEATGAAEERAAVSLVRVVPRNERGRENASLGIDVGGATIRVTLGFDQALLRDVVQALREVSS